jgi:WD40 repeat protein
VLLALQAVSVTHGAGIAVPVEVVNALHQAVGQLHLQLTLSGHTDGVVGVAFSPDGKYLFTSSLDSTAKIWDAATGRELRTLTGHTGYIYALALSPDGTRLATCGVDKTARVWDVDTGQVLLVLSLPDEVNRVVFSPDGTRLVTGDVNDGLVKVWDATTGQELLTLTGHSSRILRLAFSPDGTRLATVSNDRTAKIWELPSGRELITLAYAQTTSSGAGVAFSPDGTRLATTIGVTTRVWDAASGQPLLALPNRHRHRQLHRV